MYEVDFLPVESDGGTSSKCGDAIAMTFTYEEEQRQAVVVIDGGYSKTGIDLVEHIDQYYGTRDIDLVVSTHPDADHINGLKSVLENAKVHTLMMHQPRRHVKSAKDFSNIEAVDELVSLATNNGIQLVEPFTGCSWFDGQFTVLGPTQEYYVELVEQHLAEERTGIAAARRQPVSGLSNGEMIDLSYSLALMPPESLTDDGETGPRNNSSVISLLRVGEDRLLFTGDAGIPALEKAADYYEFNLVGSFSGNPLRFLQIPHHGSKRNLGPTILDRMVGTQSSIRSINAIISSAKACEDHPSPKVVNAATRRGCYVVATEGKTVCLSDGSVSRYGWTSIAPLGPLPEAD
jgi:beta-lactamase superfamily II metal-dependent hydrolase